MRFAGNDHQGVVAGEISVGLRRWQRPRVVAGRTYRTPSGRLVVDSVTEIEADRITEADALAAGRPDVATALAQLRGEPDWPIFRIAFHRAEDADPREALAAARPGAAALAELDTRLGRLDRVSGHGPWTEATLRVIAARPGVRAPDLAESFGRETAPFKIDVRKLKNLGLTYSLAVGYRLSPRGRAYLRHLDRSRGEGRRG